MSKKGFKYIYDFVLGCIHSRPGLHAARGLQVGHPCESIHLHVWDFKTSK